MTNIRFAATSDIPYIVSLANKEGYALGFIPKPAYEAAITGLKGGKRWSLTCNDKIWIAEENSDPIGFLMASFGDVIKINQICLQPDARRLERGKLLIDTLRDYGNKLNKYNFGCACADDLESNLFWQAMGFTKMWQRKGIHYGNTWKQSSLRDVNIYRLYELQTVMALV